MLLALLLSSDVNCYFLEIMLFCVSKYAAAHRDLNRESFTNKIIITIFTIFVEGMYYIRLEIFHKTKYIIEWCTINTPSMCIVYNLNEMLLYWLRILLLIHLALIFLTKSVKMLNCIFMVICFSQKTAKSSNFSKDNFSN